MDIVSLRKNAEKVSINVDDNLTSSLSDSCNKLIELRNQIKEKKAELKNLEAEERNYSEKVIPEKMQETGVSSLKLDSGYSIQIDTKFTARQSSANSEFIYSFLRENGLSRIIKNKVSVDFETTEDNMATDLLEDLKIKYTDRVVIKQSKIEPSTYTSALREHFEKGNSLPLTELGVYLKTTTKIERK